MPRYQQKKTHLCEKERCTAPVCSGRPPGRLVVNLGDARPFEHGGYFIYDRGNDTYTGHVWEEIEDSSPDGNSDNNKFEVYVFDIPMDVYEEHDWAKKNIKRIAANAGYEADETDEMLRDGRSTDIVDRAWAMRDIALATDGWGVFDSYSDRLTSDELRERYGRDYRVYKLREDQFDELRRLAKQQLELDWSVGA